MPEARPPIANSRGRQQRNNWLVVLGVLLVLAAALAYAARDVFTVEATDAAKDAPTLAKPQAKPAPVDTKAGQELVDDDGQTLWMSPTDGPPLDLAYLPPGVEIVLALRPAELLAAPEGEKVVAALGPLGDHAIDSVERSAGVKLGAIERLVVGWQIARDGSYVATLVVTTKTPLTPAGDAFQPAAGRGRVTVIASPATIAEIKSLEGHPPPLVRDLERCSTRPIRCAT